MSQVAQLRAAIKAHPGLHAKALLDVCKEVPDHKSCSALLSNLHSRGEASRAKVNGHWCYWPPGDAPESSAGEESGRQQLAKAAPMAIPKFIGAAAQKRTDANPKPAPANPTSQTITANWRVLPVGDGSVVLIHKDTDQGWMLDAETVAAVAALGAA